MDTGHPSTRPMTASERAAFEALLHDVPGASGMRWRTGAVMAIAWVVFSGLAIGVALALVAAVRGLTGHAFDWRSSQGAAGAALIALAVAGALWPSLRRQHVAWRDAAAAQRADLADGRVSDERLRFTEAVAFREPEHDGLMYVLRSPDDRAYLVYDVASVVFDEGRMPAEPLLRPAPLLHLVRVPRSGLAIVRRFEGEPFRLGEAVPFGGDIEVLPKDDGWLPFAWGEARRRLEGTGAASARGRRR